MFKSSFRGFSRKIEGYCEEDFSGVKGYLKEREFLGSFKGISMLFQEGFKGFPGKFLGCFAGILKGVSMEF